MLQIIINTVRSFSPKAINNVKSFIYPIKLKIYPSKSVYLSKYSFFILIIDEFFLQGSYRKYLIRPPKIQ